MGVPTQIWGFWMLKLHLAVTGCRESRFALAPTPNPSDHVIGIGGSGDRERRAGRFAPSFLAHIR